VLLVARNGKVGYFKAIGFQDREKQITMKPDSIFWIASLTKPIATVAAMMLVEQGKIQIDDPVARYLPELSSMQVGVEKTVPCSKTSFIRRSINDRIAGVFRPDVAAVDAVREYVSRPMPSAFEARDEAPFLWR
jgi:CubicO group peptidase (beta-lactamase class C family)